MDLIKLRSVAYPVITFLNIATWLQITFTSMQQSTPMSSLAWPHQVDKLLWTAKLSNKHVTNYQP